VDSRGRIVFGDQLLALFARDVLTRVPGAEIIFDVKCSQGLIEDIAAHGGRPSMWKTGHSLIKSRLHETGAPLAGEMSGHMFFSEGFFGFDDALFAAGRLLRYVAATGTSLAELVDSIPHYFATPKRGSPARGPQVRGGGGAQARVRGALPIIDIDGVRVEFGDGWGLVRASNTQAVLVVRFEARTAARLEEIRNLFMEPLRAWEWERRRLDTESRARHAPATAAAAILRALPAGRGARAARTPPGARHAAGPLVGRIVEVEAYAARAIPPVTRSAARRRATHHVRPPGHAYVYFSYGMHHCLNVVTGRRERQRRCLIRRTRTAAGTAGTWRGAAGCAEPERLARGPGCVAQALGTDPRPRRSRPHPRSAVDRRARAYMGATASPAVQRIGISRATTLPWRFFLAGHPCVLRNFRARRSTARGARAPLTRPRSRFLVCAPPCRVFGPAASPSGNAAIGLLGPRCAHTLTRERNRHEPLATPRRDPAGVHPGCRGG
jgi:3-methyladenine DNA glycosylase Mpg